MNGETGCVCGNEDADAILECSSPGCSGEGCQQCDEVALVDSPMGQFCLCKRHMRTFVNRFRGLPTGPKIDYGPDRDGNHLFNS